MYTQSQQRKEGAGDVYAEEHEACVAMSVRCVEVRD